MTPQRTLKGRTKSKSKTFEKNTSTHEIEDWLFEHVGFEYVGDDISNVDTVTDSKYIITVTKVIEDDIKERTGSTESETL